MLDRAVFVSLSVSLAALTLACKKEEAPLPPPPPEVLVAQVLQRDVPLVVEAIGQTRGSNEIEIRARVEGFVQSVDYAEGTLVEPGQLLYTIDPKPFEATLARTKAALAEAEANQARARQDVVRYEPLVAKNAISREEYETAVAIEKAAIAGVEAAKAVVESAEIDLGYTKVYAPVQGLAGRTEVYPGTLVSRVTSTLLTQISTLDPIHTRITITEREYLRFARRREAEGRQEGTKAPFELVLADGSVHPHPGALTFVDRAVDPRTATILLEVAFPNPGGIVRPGQYARARVAVETRKGALLVPQRAVQELQGITNVALVGEGNKVEIRAVQTGERIGNLWLVESGLKAGEKFIVEGMQKVRPGGVVTPKLVELDPQTGAPKLPPPPAAETAKPAAQGKKE